MSLPICGLKFFGFACGRTLSKRFYHELLITFKFKGAMMERKLIAALRLFVEAWFDRECHSETCLTGETPCDMCAAYYNARDLLRKIHETSMSGRVPGKQ